MTPLITTVAAAVATALLSLAGFDQEGSPQSPRERAATPRKHQAAMLDGPLPSAAAIRAAAAFYKNGDRALHDADYARAAQQYEQAARAHPSNPLFRLTTGVALAALRRSDKAAAWFREAVSLADDDVIAALLLQSMLAEQNKTAEAQLVGQDVARRFARADKKPGLDASGSIARLRAATRRFSNSPIVFLLLGDAYQLEGENGAAEAAYNTAMRLAPLWSKPVANLGLLRLGQGRNDEAFRAFQTALKLDPRDPQLQLWKGDALAGAGRRNDALETLRRLEKMPRVAAEAMTRIGQLYGQSRELDTARSYLGRAQRIAPRDPAPVASLGDIEVQSGNFAAGAAAYKTALRLTTTRGDLFSSRAVLHRRMAEAQLSARQPDAALASLRQALEDEPASAPLWYRLMAQAYFDKNDGPSAVRALRGALDTDLGLFPQETLTKIAAHNLLSSVAGSYQADLRGPDRFAALVALAHLARYQNDTPGEIKLRRQLTGERSIGLDWFLLADAYDARAGDLDEARRAYERALSLGGLPAFARDWADKRVKALAPKK